MMKKSNLKGKRGRQLLKAAPFALLLLYGNQLLAQASSETTKTTEGTSVLEILGYVGMIIGVILLAWIIGSAQSKSKPSEGPPRPASHRHFDHPNDPHFRKLKKKTS